MATMTLDNGNRATFGWETNMSGHQILSGVLESPEREVLETLSWEIGEDNRSLSEIEREMLDELEARPKVMWVSTPNEPESGDFGAIGFMSVGELLSMPADTIVWLSPLIADGEYQFTARTGLVKKYDGSEEIPLIKWALRKGVA